MQDEAEASQKLTCPGDTSTVPASTVAASVTALPEATEPPEGIALEPAKIVRVVVVGVGVAHAAWLPVQRATVKSVDTNNRWGFPTFKAISKSFFRKEQPNQVRLFGMPAASKLFNFPEDHAAVPASQFQTREKTD